ncbi:hypothetical protein M3204_01295 [Mesobacillus subterraneus]|uniref:hypothetical protein n=1 Tax=Mesobacillus subterraneus TaxID=285983 RepID=UPI00203B6488|nr:hypothetical protein [Mesobacillus subterraneus]MCM3663020.1 hypothetical protein [Mesobacillus subterraneus]MCM3682804.1 hypothetical protein [Mesobacillus subterraneus]
MERAVIFGVYDYIGYSLCQYMLDMGVEIDGVHSGSSTEEYFTEEKRLEIGRNANFSEKKLKEWVNTGAVELLFISLFESDQSSTANGIFTDMLLKKLEYSNSSIILILPAYFAVENEKMEESQRSLLRFFEKRKHSVLEVYLPTIYGPWQPEGFFFQQALNYLEDGKHTPEIAGWEWTHDAIYIDDAITEIVEMAEAGEKGKVLLSSGEKNRWLKCAEQLLGREKNQRWRHAGETPEIKDVIRVRSIKRNENIGKGLNKQKEQYYRIQESRV